LRRAKSGPIIPRIVNPDPEIVQVIASAVGILIELRRQRQLP
jgi:hypothetical protein